MDHRRSRDPKRRDDSPIGTREHELPFRSYMIAVCSFEDRSGSQDQRIQNRSYRLLSLYKSPEKRLFGNRATTGKRNRSLKWSFWYLTFHRYVGMWHIGLLHFLTGWSPMAIRSFQPVPRVRCLRIGRERRDRKSGKGGEALLTSYIGEPTPPLKYRRGPQAIY